MQPKRRVVWECAFISIIFYTHTYFNYFCNYYKIQLCLIFMPQGAPFCHTSQN